MATPWVGPLPTPIRYPPTQPAPQFPLFHQPALFINILSTVFFKRPLPSQLQILFCLVNLTYDRSFLSSYAAPRHLLCVSSNTDSRSFPSQLHLAGRPFFLH